MIKGTIARSKVKLISHHDIAHLHPQQMSRTSINILQIQPGHEFKCWDHIGKIKVKSRSYWQDQRLNQGHTMTFLTYTPN